MSGEMTVGRALAQSGLAPLDAQVLLAHVLGRDRAWLVAHAGDALARDAMDAFIALARRRRVGEPVAHLTGSREFWGLSLAVSPAVLIPRPETETVVELALARLPEDRAVRVLDLGPGSGAIALAIAHERPRARILATDVCAEALAIARENARRLRIGNVAFVQSDWYTEAASIARAAPFDLIASNPPYVAADDPHLAEGDVRFEPAAALSAGAEGLDAIRVVVAGAREWLAPGGSLVIEHGYDQSARVGELFAAAGFADVTARHDLAGIARVVAGCRAAQERPRGG
jgi:release factor glutamine methyltransferase